MGFLTTITVYNDDWYHNSDPKKLGEAICLSWQESEYNRVPSCIRNVIVQPSYHADEHQLYIHWGNTIQNINPWTKDFIYRAKTNYEFLKESIEKAEQIVKDAKKELKKLKNENPNHLS